MIDRLTHQMEVLLVLPKRYSPARLGSMTAGVRRSCFSMASSTARPPADRQQTAGEGARRQPQAAANTEHGLVSN
jgi:hypothetical protein